MTNQQLKAHCEDVIANPQDHLDWVVDMARVALASLEAQPVGFFTYHEDEDGDPTDFIVESDSFAKNSFKLYRSPPAPELKLPEPINWRKAHSLLDVNQCGEDRFEALIKHNIAKINSITPQFMKEVLPGVKRHLQCEIDSAKLALDSLRAALTQPASPALKLPWSEKTCRECGCKSLSWGFAIINKSTVQNGLLRISDVDGLFYLGCDECSETVTQVSPDEVVDLLSALQQSIDAPHTAPIEPICATGRTMPPHEFSQMVNELRDVDNTQSKRAKIVGVLHAFNIRPRKPE